MTGINLFFQTNGFQVLKNENFVELKIPSELFDKAQNECLKYDSFCKESPSPKMIVDDCMQFAYLCQSFEKNDSFQMTSSEEMFMKEFIDRNPLFVSNSKTIDLSSDVLDILCGLECFQKLDTFYRPALLAYLSYKYSRPRLYSAMIMDANLREKIREWQLQMTVPDSSLISLFHIKKDAVDEVARSFQHSVTLNPPFMLDAELLQGKEERLCGKSGSEFENDENMAVQITFLALKELTQHLVKIMREHEKEIGEADVKCITLEEMLMEMRADVIQLRHEREIALNNQVDTDLPAEERSAMMAGLKKAISIEAKLKRENIALREERDRVIQNSAKIEQKNKVLENKLAELEGKLQATTKHISSE